MRLNMLMKPTYPTNVLKKTDFIDMKKGLQFRKIKAPTTTKPWRYKIQLRSIVSQQQQNQKGNNYVKFI